MSRTSLDDILDGNTPVAPDTPDTPEPQVEPAPEPQPRDESGKFAPKGEEDPKPAEQLPKDVYEPLRAVRDENKALKEQLEQLSKQVQANQQPKEPPAPPPSLWEDEQGWQQHFGGQVAQQAALNARLDMSEMLARRDHEDFDAMKAEFLKIAEANPALAEQAISDPDPWRKAYQIARNARTMQELGATDLDALKAKMREELLAELQAQQPAPPPSLPATLSTQRSVASRSGPAWAGPTPLGDLIGN